MRTPIRWALGVATIATLLLASHMPARALDLLPLPLNKCLAGKIKCVVKKKSCLLGCHAKAAAAGVPVEAACVDKCRNGFDSLDSNPKDTSCFEKLEVKGGCLTTGDDDAIEGKTDALVLDAVEQLRPTPAANKCTASKLKCLIKYNSCILGLYAKAAGKGIGSGAPGKCDLSACFDKLELKPGCATSDDSGELTATDNAYIDDLMCELQAGPHDMNNQRCTGDTSVRCTTAPGGLVGCGGPLGTCEFFFGSNLPLSSGGVPTCVTSQWNGTISGITNPGTGVSAGTANLISRVYNGITISQPCPQCNGDRWPTDGLKGGTCLGGGRNGLPCDADGTSPNPAFGTTSLDCPPIGGALVGTLPINLDNTNNGNATLTLSAASPNCHGAPGKKCPCDVCSLNQSKPCQTNADCLLGEGTCGGAVVGQPTQPNACIGGLCDAQEAGDATSGEGECSNGPVDQNCAPPEQQIGCSIGTDCPLTGICQAANRKCFAGFDGNIGDSIVGIGTHAAPVDGWSRPTFASVFCVPPTSAAAVNAVAGLPGPGRLVLTGVAHDNGETDATDSTPACPTLGDFTGTSRGGVLDTGWTGIAHDASTISGGKVTVAVSCPGTQPNCGNCTYTGPIPNANAAP
jgi:hypothetical protein